MVVPPGFEPRSEEPESSMMDRYTKGLCDLLNALTFSIKRYRRIYFRGRCFMYQLILTPTYEKDANYANGPVNGLSWMYGFNG